MAQSEVHSATAATLDTAVSLSSAQGERKLRRVIAWLLLIFLVQGELGAVWDREWHAYVGRDQFWTPPHTLIYSCVAGAGLIALAMVFVETFRYRRHVPGVDDTSTVPIFSFFHAPLGFSVLGFGALIALIAAPLDNYWHELYGIDIALWAPFHMMGVTGGLIGILGMIYVFASEAAIERQAGGHPRRLLGLTALEIGVILAMASLLNFVLTGFLQFPLITLGSLQFSTYPLPLVVGAACFLLAAVRVTNKPGMATLVVLVLLLHTLLVELFVPWAIRASVAQQGLQFRIPGQIPHFSISYALVPLSLLVSSIIVDIAAYRQKKKTGQTSTTMRSAILLGVLTAPPTFVIAPLILLPYSPYAPVFLPEPGLPIFPALWIFGVAFAVLLGLIAGGVGGLMGADFGDIWRRSER